MSRAQTGIRPHAAICVALCAVSALAAQGPPPPQQQAGPAPAVRVTTRLVQISVIVQDSKGEPVTCLSKEDFQVFDKGQPQEVSRFSVVEARHKAQPAGSPAANTFSNRFEQRTNSPTSATVILVDELNTGWADNVYTRQQTIKLLRQVKPQDRVALYLLRGNLHILHDFTSDATALLRALEKHRSGDSSKLAASNPEPPDTGDAEMDAFLQAANERIEEFYTTNRVVYTVDALTAIARHLASVPGRKNLVWISGSFPAVIQLDTGRPTSFHHEIEKAGRALSDANVAVYPVDARGLIGGFGLSRNPGAMRSRATTLRPPSANQYGFQTIAQTHDTMVEIAQKTGGRAFYNTNDIQGSIRKAISDSRVTYLLGFYPTHQDWNGEFRSLKVQVAKKGLHLRYRKGYVAAADQPAAPETRLAALRAAALGPLEAGEIGLTAYIKPVSSTGTDTVVVDLRIDLRDLTLRPNGNRQEGSVEILFLQRAADGNVLARWDYNLPVNLSGTERLEALRDGVRAGKHMPVAKNAVDLRIVVRDASSGAIGSLSIPVQKVLRAGSGQL